MPRMAKLNFSDQNGQSLIEMLLGLTVGAIMIIVAVGALSVSLRTNYRDNFAQDASFMNEALLENVISTAEGFWGQVAAFATGCSSVFCGILYHFPEISKYGQPDFNYSEVVYYIVPCDIANYSVKINGNDYYPCFRVRRVSRAANGVIEAVYNAANDDPSTLEASIKTRWVNGSISQETPTLTRVVTRKQNEVYLQSNWEGGPTTPADSAYTTPVTTFYSLSAISYGTIGEIKLQSPGSGETGILFSNAIFAQRQVTLNSVMWQGSLPSGSGVEFQIASSNCANGATDAQCLVGSWGSSNCFTTGGTNSCYIGPAGTSDNADTYTATGPNIQMRTNGAHHGDKLYFRYKIMLKRGNGNNTPNVADVILNWSI